MRQSAHDTAYEHRSPEETDAPEPARSKVSVAPKVCVLTSVHRADDHRLRKEARALNAAGYRVVMIVPHERDETIDNYQVRALPRPRNRPERMTRTAWSLYKAARREEAAIYHFHDPELVSVGMLLKASGRRVVYDAHEDVPRDIMLKTYIPIVPRWLIAQGAKLMQRACALAFDGIVVAADHLLPGFQRSRRAISVRNFPDLARFQATQRTHEDGVLRLIYIGSLSAARGIGKLVDALGLVREDLNVKLRLFGTFDPPGMLDELKQLKGWRRVEFGGLLDSDAIPAMLSKSDIGMVCLQPTETYVAATPTKLYEYLAAGLPVIGSNFPVYRDIVEQYGCGVCVDPTQPAQIARAIEQLAAEPLKREALGRRGKEISGKFDWQGESAKLANLYAAILSRADL